MEKKMNYAWPVTSVNKEDYDALMDWINAHKENLGKLVVFGAGIRGTEFSIILEREGINDIVFVDNNEKKWGGYINEYPIVPPEYLKQLAKGDKVIISTEYFCDIDNQLSGYGLKKDEDYYVIKSDLYEKYMEEFRRKYSNRVLLMADCEFTKVSVNDRDMTNLKEMLQEKMGIEDIKILAMHGMGIRAYYNIIHAQCINGMKPECIVVMVNFDTLTGKQHLLPKSQHVPLIESVYKETKKHDKELEEYYNVVHERVHNLQVEMTIPKSKDEKLAQLKRNRNYIYMNYMYPLDINVEGMEYLEKLLNYAKEENIKVLAYIPTVNYQFARELFGEKFDEIYNDNVKKVRDIVEEYAELYDMSYEVGKDCFACEDTPDETLNEKGRNIVANLFYDRITELIR